MTPTALVLITLSVVAHAGWNFFSKTRPSLAFFAVSVLASMAALAPLAALDRTLLPAVPAAVWRLVAATGLFQAVYFTGLAGAYRHGELSVVYPVLRALPVLGVTALSLLLGQGAPIAPPALAGIALVALGCLLLPLDRFAVPRPRDYAGPALWLALVAAAGTTGYTLIDDAAQRFLRGELPGLGPLRVTAFYVVLQTYSTGLWMALALLAWPAERRRLRALGGRGALAAGLTGLVITGAYALVLAAMAFVSNVGYVAAFRQLSILLGAALGMALLGERPHGPKLLGLAAVTAGLVLVALY
ncbi:hypothetical protein [Oceanithermus profundus]